MMYPVAADELIDGSRLNYPLRFKLTNSDAACARHFYPGSPIPVCTQAPTKQFFGLIFRHANISHYALDAAGRPICRILSGQRYYFRYNPVPKIPVTMPVLVNGQQHNVFGARNWFCPQKGVPKLARHMRRGAGCEQRQ
jgi:hypothetical protein